MKWNGLFLALVLCAAGVMPLFGDDAIEAPVFDGYCQTRLHYYKPDSDADPYDIWFTLAKGRLGVKGTMYKKLVSYRIVAEYAGGAFKLLDYYTVLNAHRSLKVRAGQFKVPFTRQYYQSAAKHAFVDLALPVRNLHDGRDIGLEVFCTDAKEGMIEYHLGVFNGNGSNRTANDNTDFEIAGKALAKFGTIDPGQEGLQAMESGFAVGFSGFLNHTGVDTTGEERKGLAGEVTAGARGFFLTGEYLQLTRSAGDTDVTSGGFYGQAAYMVMPRRLELVGRYAQFDPNSDADDDVLTEIRGGVIFYHAGHNHKLSVEGVQYTQQTAADDVSSMGAAVQYQFNFK